MTNIRLDHLGQYRAGKTSQKTFVEFNLYGFGSDLIVVIGGGESHIGSLAYSDKKQGAVNHSYTLQDHREDTIVKSTIDGLSCLVQGEVMVIGGIHYDQISKEQIKQINNHCQTILNRIKTDLYPFQSQSIKWD